MHKNPALVGNRKCVLCTHGDKLSSFSLFLNFVELSIGHPFSSPLHQVQICFLISNFACSFLASYFSYSICNGTIWLSRNFPSSLMLCRSNYTNVYHLGKQRFTLAFLQSGKGFSQLCSEKNIPSWLSPVHYMFARHCPLEWILIKNNLPTRLITYLD